MEFVNNNLKKVCIGIDLGGSHITCILSDINGIIIDKLNEVINDRSIDNVLNIIANTCNNLINRNKDIQCLGIGIGIPGNVDPINGNTRYLPNFGWLEPVNIGDYLKKNVGNGNLRISMRNDGRCAAIAEFKYGAGINSNVLAMLTIGTGIGGALIIKGNLFDGSTFDAGDFGHHVIHSGSLAFDCVCGKKGCFEYHASADGLLRHYKKLNGNKNIQNAYEFMNELRSSNKDPIIIQAFNDFRDDLSTGLANLVTFYNPDTIILGGGLSQASELFDGLVEMVDKKTLPATRGKVKIIPAMLSTDAGAIGAAAIAFSEVL